MSLLESKVFWARIQGSVSSAKLNFIWYIGGQSLHGEESLHVFSTYSGLNPPRLVSKLFLRLLLQSATFKYAA